MKGMSFVRGNRKNGWKILIFGIVIAALLGIAVFSCTKKKDSSSKDKQENENVDLSQGIISLSSLRQLDSLAAGKDVAFILLPGDKRDSLSEILEQIEITVAGLTKEEKRVTAFILDEGAQGYDQMMRQFINPKFPIVVAMAKGRLSTAIAGEINEPKLRNAFNLAITSKPRPGSNQDNE